MRRHLPRRFWLCLLGAAALALPLDGASADFQDGNKLYQNCANQDLYAPYGACVGYVMAIVDILNYQPFNRYRACTPPTVIANQAVDVAMQFLRRHPELRHYAASGLVAQALSEAFPCQ